MCKLRDVVRAIFYNLSLSSKSLFTCTRYFTPVLALRSYELCSFFLVFFPRLFWRARRTPGGGELLNSPTELTELLNYCRTAELLNPGVIFYFFITDELCSDWFFWVGLCLGVWVPVFFFRPFFFSITTTLQSALPLRTSHAREEQRWKTARA